MKRKVIREANAAKISNYKRAIQQSCREQPPRPSKHRNEAAGPSRTGSQQAEIGEIAAANSVPNVSSNSVPPGPTARDAAGASIMGPQNPTPTPSDAANVSGPHGPCASNGARESAPDSNRSKEINGDSLTIVWGLCIVVALRNSGNYDCCVVGFVGVYLGFDMI
ncbi:hypothetical protein COLO4_37686 [Corchorus olitorius]|uniref:Uncharacterized protein n=1 Tax=Corchorus olitorius TaxID=93759 RepID=A0A1R3FZX9_9ROSI|nr:hypothetical protein COLO4_37686 [Corchorus olitorius]